MKRVTWAPPGLLALLILTSYLLVPVLGAFLLVLLPAPLAYSRFRYGGLSFAVTAFLCILFVSLMGGSFGMSLLVMGFCIAAYTLGGSLKSGEPYDKAVLKGALLPVLVMGAVAGAFFLAQGINPWSLLDRSLDAAIDESVVLYRKMGMSQSDIDSLLPSLRMFTKVISDYLPAVVVSFMSMVSFLCYIIIRRHAALTTQAAPPAAHQDTQMTRWVAPDHAVWGVIVPGFLMLIPNVPVLRQAAGNLLVVFALVFLFQGLAVTVFMFDRIRLSFLLRLLSIFLVALQPYLFLAIFGAGLFDTWADFRKLRGKG